MSMRYSFITDIKTTLGNAKEAASSLTTCIKSITDSNVKALQQLNVNLKKIIFKIELI